MSHTSAVLLLLQLLGPISLLLAFLSSVWLRFCAIRSSKSRFRRSCLARASFESFDSAPEELFHLIV